MDNMIVYYDERGNEIARFIFDPSLVDAETVDKALYDAVSSILPVDNSSEDSTEEEDDEDADE